MAAQSLTGYRRPHGRPGIRDHVLIIAVDDLSNAVAGSAARAVPGTLPLPRPCNVVGHPVNGRLTGAEAPGHREFALTRLHPSA